MSEPPLCIKCDGPSVGETPQGPMCEPCARRRAHTRYCTARIPHVCQMRATINLDTDEPLCGGCHRSLTRSRTRKWENAGGRGVPAAQRRRVLDRDNHKCRIRTPGLCVGDATQVDHIKGVAETERAEGRRISRDEAHPINADTNLRSACAPCHTKRSEQQRVSALSEANRKRAAHRRARLGRPDEKHPGDD